MITGNDFEKFRHKLKQFAEANRAVTYRQQLLPQFYMNEETIPSTCGIAISIERESAVLTCRVNK